MATINYEYYSGIDAYSDGDIEDVLLNMVQQKVDIQELSKEDVSYPVIYHLSHLRENIINWYPIEKKQTVLEIGSGCGAITNALCKKAKRVVSVELSKRRALINYTRNQDKTNLEIIVGNFNQIDFQEKFDYVILNGVFEYGLSFIEGDEPYIRFLNLCKNFLKESGKILVAIENRLGIKYFTGAPEDHTKNYLEGINQYKENNSVRTFSKSEWKAMLEKCELSCKFYYPYPDYKFPEEIYTDASLKSGMYGKPYFNYDSERFGWINEHLFAHTLVEEDVIGVFVNSFLLEITKDSQFSDIEYSKISCDRRKECRIITIIHNNNGKRSVEKIAADSLAVEHINKLIKNSARGTEEKIFCLQGKTYDGKAVFEYLTTITFEKQIISNLDKMKKEDVFLLLKTFFENYFEQFPLQEFEQGEEFREKFGNEEAKKNYQGIIGGNIDLVLDNIYQVDDRYCIIDCEWIFDFVVPIKFIVWRSLNDFCYKHEEVQKLFSKEEIFKYFDIEEDDTQTFLKWNAYFAYEWLKANGAEKYSKPIRYVAMDDLVNIYKSEHYLHGSLYYDCGEGYSEENKLFSIVALEGKNFNITFELPKNIKINRLRFDPIEKRGCRCRIKDCNVKFLPTNAYRCVDGWDVFLTDDPSYEVVLGNEFDLKQITICGELDITDLREWYNQLHGEFQKQLVECQMETNCLKKKIEQQEIYIIRIQKEFQEIRSSLEKEIQCNKNELQHTQNLLKNSQDENRNLNEKVVHLNAVLESIYNSKGWKVLSFIKRIIKGKEY